jgi:hypothetical protein
MNRSSSSTADADRAEPAVERSDAPPRGIAYAVLGLFGGLGVSALFVAAMLYAFEPEHQAVQTPPEGPQLASLTPPLEVAPIADGAAVRVQAEQKLHGYAWIDRQGGVARIPIERAMELTAERGWPDGAGKEKR